jgi:hypothetical protein
MAAASVGEAEQFWLWPRPVQLRTRAFSWSPLSRARPRQAPACAGSLQTQMSSLKYSQHIAE